MQVEYERCCGIDVHKETVVACLIVPDAQGHPVKETRTFSTMTGDLQALGRWLAEQGCTHVVMESTGVYWKPVYNLLERQFALLVVNPTSIKKLRGPKTDVADAEWLADLLRHGLVRGSFIPSAEQRALRDLTRYRTQLLDERTREVNRVQKVLEDANIKLASVATDIMGVSGRAILQELLEGEGEPALLAELAKGRLRNKRALLEQALTGKVQAHHRFLLVQHLSHIDYLDEQIAQLDSEVAERMRPFEAALASWEQLPGIRQRNAQVIVAELGADLQQFPDAEHCASWAAICPGTNESAGKRHSGKTAKGNRWLKRALTEAAHGAARTKKSYYAALYHRLAGRRGKKRAIIAVAHSLLVTGYHLVTQGVDYQDLGRDYFDKRNQETIKRRAVKRLEQLGYQVDLTPVPALAG
ncbi:MAG TPA: IS110 family transposase [Anaerolineales bacterium]|nr:IS110 family transposase [Anaerolineales bacterium]